MSTFMNTQHYSYILITWCMSCDIYIMSFDWIPHNFRSRNCVWCVSVQTRFSHIESHWLAAILSHRLAAILSHIGWQPYWVTLELKPAAILSHIGWQPYWVIGWQPYWVTLVGSHIESRWLAAILSHVGWQPYWVTRLVVYQQRKAIWMNTDSSGLMCIGQNCIWCVNNICNL